MCAAAPCKRRETEMRKEIKVVSRVLLQTPCACDIITMNGTIDATLNHSTFREWSMALASSISCWKLLLHPWPGCHQIASASVFAPSLRSRVQSLYRLQARTLHAHQTSLCYYTRRRWRPSGSQRSGPVLGSLV